MKHVTAVLSAILATAAVALLSTVGASAAAKACNVVPKAAHTPYLLSPCDGARVPERRSVTFVVHDSDPMATKSVSGRPYLNLVTSRKLQDGHLVSGTDGTGIFAQLAPLAGHKDEWTLVSKPQIYKSWWDNHPGTVYVQIQQIDSPASTAGVTYGPIVALHVVPVPKH